MLENKKDQNVYTRKSLVMHFRDWSKSIGGGGPEQRGGGS